MKEHEDAYGRLLLDYLEGKPAPEIVEREDGFINVRELAVTQVGQALGRFAASTDPSYVGVLQRVSRPPV